MTELTIKIKDDSKLGLLFAMLRRLVTSEGVELSVEQNGQGVALDRAIVQPTTSLQVVRDPKDDPIVECAVDGNANVIVSYDNDLLSLKDYNNIPILHVVDLLHTLGE